MWYFKHDAIPNTFIDRYFSIRVNSMWWSYEHNKFVETIEDVGKKGASSSKSIGSFKAFKRFLRKHSYLKGKTVLLESRWSHNNVVAKWIDHENR